jgi:hypothetical protein
LARSHGLVVKADGSWSRGRWFKPRHCILDGCKQFASYCIKEKLKIKVAKWGAPQFFFFKEIVFVWKQTFFNATQLVLRCWMYFWSLLHNGPDHFRGHPKCCIFLFSFFKLTKIKSLFWMKGSEWEGKSFIQKPKDE